MDNLVKFKRDAEWIIRTSKACPSAAKGLPKARRTSPHECFAFRTYGSIRTHPQSIKKATRWVAFFIDALSGLFVRTGTRIYALMNLRFARFRTSGSIHSGPMSTKKATRWVAFFVEALSGFEPL